MMKRIGIVWLLFPLMLSGQVKVHRVDGNDGFIDKQGFFYALPLTMFRVDILVEKTEYFRGPYADYALKYLGLEKPVLSDNNQYKILGINLSTGQKPDPDNVFFAEIDEKLIKDGKTIALSISENGMLESYDSRPLNQENGGHFQSTPAGMERFGYYAGANRIQVTDTIIRKVVVDTAVSVKKTFSKRWEMKSDEKKAEEAAGQIQRLRESRLNLLTGFQEIPYESGTIRYMEEKLEDMIKEYMSLFAGISFTSTLVYSFTVTPEPDDDKNILIPVCMFSEQYGLRDLSSAAGTKIMLNLNRSEGNPGLYKSVDSRQVSSKSDKGFFYRIPETVHVTVKPDFGIPVEGWFSVNQLGKVTWLPPGITMLELHPETGAIKNILLK